MQDVAWQGLRFVCCASLAGAVSCVRVCVAGSCLLTQAHILCACRPQHARGQQHCTLWCSYSFMPAWLATGLAVLGPRVFLEFTPVGVRCVCSISSGVKGWAGAVPGKAISVTCHLQPTKQDTCAGQSYGCVSTTVFKRACQAGCHVWKAPVLYMARTV